MKKKMLSLVKAMAMVTLVAALAGCGATNQETGQSTAGTTSQGEVQTTAQSQSAKRIVGFLEKNEVDVYHVALNSAVTKVLERAKSEGIIADYFVMDGQSDPVKQNNQMEELINMGCTDFICIFAEGEGAVPIVDRVAELGANLVNVDSMAANIDDYEQFVRVNPDNIMAANMQAEYAMSLMDGGGYCILSGISGNMVAQQRHDGVREVLDNNDSWKLLDEQWADWDPEKSVKFMEDWLSLYGNDLKVVFCGNDTMAIAAAGVCNAAGRDDIVIIGIDAIESAINMIENDEMNATIWQDSNLQATTAAEILIKLIQGEQVDHYVEIPNTLITKENVDQWYAGQPE